MKRIQSDNSSLSSILSVGQTVSSQALPPAKRVCCFNFISKSTFSPKIYSSDTCVYDRVFKMPRKESNTIRFPHDVSHKDSEPTSISNGYKEDQPSDLFLSLTDHVGASKSIHSSTPFLKPPTSAHQSSSVYLSMPPQTPNERRMYKNLLDQATMATPQLQTRKFRDKSTIIIDEDDQTDDIQGSSAGRGPLVLQHCKLSPIERKTRNSVGDMQNLQGQPHVIALPTELDETDHKARSWIKACEQTPYLSESWLSNLTSDYQSKANERERIRQLAEVKLKHWENQRMTDSRRRMQNLEQRLSCLLLTPPVLHDPYLVPQPIPIELPYVPRRVMSIPSVLPVLSDSQSAQVDATLRGGSPDELITENFNLSVTRRELLTLSGTNWLSDMVINFYMQLLSHRSKASPPGSNSSTSRPPSLPRIAVLSTFFYAKLTSPAGTGYSGVRRWSRQLKLFDQDLILIPIHDRGMHWCLAAVDLGAKTITYYDSMGSPNQKCLQALLSYLEEECQDKKGHPLPNPEAWRLINSENSVPQQMNGSDCGVFMCTFGEFLSRRSKFTFSQDDMPGIRRRMIYEIVTQQLLTTGFRVATQA